MLHGLCFGEEAGAPNLVFFRVKWLQPTMKGTSSVRRVRLRSFCARIVPPMLELLGGYLSVARKHYQKLLGSFGGTITKTCRNYWENC